MKRVAASFSWPFRGSWPSRFAIGSLLVLFLPITFVLLLGYAITATRAAEDDPEQPPPPWTLSLDLIFEGWWTSTVLLLLTVPFIVVFNPLSDAIERAHLWQVSDRPLSSLYAHMAAAFLLALPWGLLVLLLMPHGTSRYAASGRARDLFDFPASLRGVKEDFPIWNLAVATMVTAWVVGVAGVGLLCVGILPGIVYAILVSAYASATLHSPPDPPGTNPAPG